MSRPQYFGFTTENYSLKGIIFIFDETGEIKNLLLPDDFDFEQCPEFRFLVDPETDEVLKVYMTALTHGLDLPGLSPDYLRIHEWHDHRPSRNGKPKPKGADGDMPRFFAVEGQEAAEADEDPFGS